jgi:hypothetical protein
MRDRSLLVVVEKLLKDREDDLEKLIAISHVKRAAETGVTKASLVDMVEATERDVRKFRALLVKPPARRKVAAARRHFMLGNGTVSSMRVPWRTVWPRGFAE